MSTSQLPLDIAPSLRAVIQNNHLSDKSLTVAAQVNARDLIEVKNRSVVFVTDGEKTGTWEVVSLRALFRGQRKPPADLEQYPPSHVPYFWLIERHVLLISKIIGDRTDQEMEQVYSLLCRRPDSRSIGPTHDVLWQAAALLLGLTPLSEAEFTAIFGVLTKSTRKWAQSPISRNYIHFLRESIG